MSFALLSRFLFISLLLQGTNPADTGCAVRKQSEMPQIETKYTISTSLDCPGQEANTLFETKGQFTFSPDFWHEVGEDEEGGVRGTFHRFSKQEASYTYIKQLRSKVVAITHKVYPRMVERPDLPVNDAVPAGKVLGHVCKKGTLNDGIANWEIVYTKEVDVSEWPDAFPGKMVGFPWLILEKRRMSGSGKGELLSHFKITEITYLPEDGLGLELAAGLDHFDNFDAAIEADLLAYRELYAPTIEPDNQLEIESAYSFQDNVWEKNIEFTKIDGVLSANMKVRHRAGCIQEDRRDYQVERVGNRVVLRDGSMIQVYLLSEDGKSLFRSDGYEGEVFLAE